MPRAEAIAPDASACKRAKLILSGESCRSARDVFVLNSLSCKGKHLRLPPPPTHILPYSIVHCARARAYLTRNSLRTYTEEYTHTHIYVCTVDFEQVAWANRTIVIRIAVGQGDGSTDRRLVYEDDHRRGPGPVFPREARAKPRADT